MTPIEVTGLTWAHVAAFNVALLFAVAAPGPAFLLCTHSALTGGRREGIVVGMGLAVVAGLWTLAALLGLEALFDAFPMAYTAMKVGGAVLILGFAVVAWRTAGDPIQPKTPRSRRQAFLRGAALNLANPKSILFSAGVLLVIFPPGLSGTQMTLITINHIVLEVVVYAILATMLSRPSVRARYVARRTIMGRIMAVVLGGLGLRLLVMP
ncbi:LysE family translocator [Jannaschia sp. LMIT008]|uniref:LysE family translocator n=1 Tax=Jannaschia maritima TaxID=3032585 RepID=UPI002811E8B1|nr:LysE family translocator [Jannaschia sp. LMIT008]